MRRMKRWTNERVTKWIDGWNNGGKEDLRDGLVERWLNGWMDE